MIKAIEALTKYLKGPIRISKRLLGKYTYPFLWWINDLSGMVLRDAHRFPWPAAQDITQGLARCAGDASRLLMLFPRLPAYKLTGPKWKIIVVSGNARSLLQIGHLFFEKEFDQEQIEKIALWKLSDQTQQWLAEGADLVVCELGRLHPYRPKSAITITSPVWIDQVITIPKRLETLISGKKSRNIRNILNRSRKNGFNYRFSQLSSDFDNFYYKMYLPFVKNRHGDLASLRHYKSMRRLFAKGGILLVTQHDKPVAGALCSIRGNTCFDLYGGVLEANPELIQQGVQTILTWYVLTWASGEGAKTYNMGGSQAYCSNPSFTAKRRWGARVVRRTNIYATWTFLATDLSTRLRNHLNKLGFISEIDGNFYRVFLTNDIDSVTETEINQEVLVSRKEGLDGLLMVSTKCGPVTYR